MYFFVFFFQAEDGIRDHCVTGVQTCALPISTVMPSRPSLPSLRHRSGGNWLVRSISAARGAISFPAKSCTVSRSRSEERRVGKSVDLGGRRIIKKKKRKEKRRLITV